MPNPFVADGKIRTYVRRTLAKIQASTSVLGAGELMVSEQGGVYGGDGATIMSVLSRLIRRNEAVNRRSLIWHDPLTHADGAINAGDLLDSGDGLTVVNNVGQNPLRYAGGRMVHTQGATVGSSNAGYLQTQVDSDRVRRVFAKVAWPANALGAAAVVVPSAKWNQSGGILPVAGLHSTHYGNGVWTCGVWNPAVGQTGHVEAHMLNVQSGTAVTLSVTTTTPNSTQATGSLTIDTTFTAASLQAALAALSNVGAGKVTVIGPFAGKYGIVWDASLGVTTVAVSASSGTPAPTVTKYGTGVTTYADYTTNGRYATVWDNTLRDLDVWLFPEDGKGIIYFPDGTNSGYVYDPGIFLWCSTYAVHELFEGNASAIDVPAQYGKVAVDNFRQRTDTPSLSKPDVSALLAISASQVLYDGGNTTTADIAVNGTIPAGAKFFDLSLLSASGGGGSGSCGSGAQGGGGAGGTAGWLQAVVPIPAGAVTWNLTVGRKGTGGASVSAAGNGNPGTGGNPTKFTMQDASGKVLAAYQAFGTGGGTAGQAGGGVAAGGSSGGPGVVGAAASSVTAGAAGASGGGNTSGLGTAGSGSGGGITSGGVANAGGPGGSNLVRGYTGGTGGVVGGATPGVGTDITATAITTAQAGGIPGPGVGAGAGSTSGAAQAGATPVQPGPGGAGGGASTTGNASGKGGDGAGGWARLGLHF